MSPTAPARLRAFLTRKSNRPLLLVLVLLCSFVLYGIYWTILLQGFKREMAQLADGAQAPLRITSAEGPRFGGFPFRFEARWDAPTLERSRPDYSLRGSAERLVVLRQVGADALYLAFAERVRLEAGFLDDGWHALTAPVEAPDLRASLRLQGDAVARLSVVLDQPRVGAGGLLAQPLAADTLEVHGREARVLQGDATAQDGARAAGPDAPPFLELLLRGTGLRLPDGQPATLTGTIVVRGDPEVPAGSGFLEPWRAMGGTVDIVGLDVTGPGGSTQIRATLALDTARQWLAAGTVTTTRPQAVRALLQVRAPPAEAPLPVAQALRLRVQDGERVLETMAIDTGG